MLKNMQSTKIAKKHLVRAMVAGWAAVTAATMAAPAEAVTVIWDVSNCATQINADDISTCGASDGPNGNIREFNSVAPNASYTLRVGGFSTTNPGNDAVDDSFLGLYPGGLGVTASGDQYYYGDGNGSNQQHTIDSFGPQDFVIFEFPQQFHPAYFEIGFASDNVEDNIDIDAYIGGQLSDDLLNTLIGQSWNGGSVLTDAGFAHELFENVSVDNPIALDGTTGRYLILAAATSITCNDTQTILAHTGKKKDKEKCGGFKVSTIAWDPPNQVAEPGALSVFSMGLFALGFMGWRQRRNRAQA